MISTTQKTIFASAALLTFLILINGSATASSTASLKLEMDERLPGAFDEKLTSRTYAPGIRVIINAARDASTTRPLNLVFYALPNGNTIEHTIGRTQQPGLDWHYYIQHIGAQTRRLRELQPGQEWVVVYLQAQSRSWPSWRKQHENHASLARDLIEDILKLYPGRQATVHLAAHSGGGGLLFSFIDASEEIPPYVATFAWLDANYAYNSAEKHGEKLLAWLDGDTSRRLFVAAYDDRHITVNGKRVVSDTGGTFRATHRMCEDLGHSRDLTSSTVESFITVSDASKQIDLRIHVNPENKILHTVLVEKNGFLQAVLPTS